MCLFQELALEEQEDRTETRMHLIVNKCSNFEQKMLQEAAVNISERQKHSEVENFPNILFVRNS